VNVVLHSSNFFYDAVQVALLQKHQIEYDLRYVFD
jgi:hypothetical protein